jgi:hypothetical protein
MMKRTGYFGHVGLAPCKTVDHLDELSDLAKFADLVR